MNLAGIDHVVIRCRNVKTMKKFYSDLGCRLVKYNDKVGIWHFTTGGSTLLDLISVDGPLGEKKGAPPSPNDCHNIDHICLRVDPFVEEEIRDHLAKMGLEGEATVTRFGADGDGPSIYIQDPEGNGIELKGRVWPINK